VADYQPLIARAVEWLAVSKRKSRRALYERARSALESQLRAVDPPLSESAIAKERLALESAIRKVETEAALKVLVRREHHLAITRPQFDPFTGSAGLATTSKAEVVTSKQTATPLIETVVPRATLETARERQLGARFERLSALLKREDFKTLRNIVNEVNEFGEATVQPAQSAHDIRERRAGLSSETGANDPSAKDHDAEQTWRYCETSFDRKENPVPEMVPLQPHEPEDLNPLSARNYRKLAYVLVVFIVFAGLSATISWQWPHIASLYRDVAQTVKKRPARPNEATSPPKFSGRVPQEQSVAPASAEAAPETKTAPAMLPRAILYEEDSNDRQRKRYFASVVWRTETVPSGSGLAPELAIQADLEIPERHINLTWALRRNSDQATASHTIEIKFNLPAHFPNDVAEVPAILMKESEQAPGIALAGLAAEVANDFFLIGLSAAHPDRQRNIKLLKKSSWIEIPIVYTDGHRSILVIEKGMSGDRAFANAFAAWEKE
jgi:hypothetical protein